MFHNKKVVIFGKLSQLDYSNLEFLKTRGAMFGLDARIALAIFGALSVITGAALYSAISNAKAMALLVDIQEVGKAWESYYVDTGVNLPRQDMVDDTSNAFYDYLNSNLVSNIANVDGWKGPYLNYKLDGAVHLRNSQYNNSNIMMILVTNEETWGGSKGDWTAGKCTAGKKCFVTIYFSGITDNESVLKKIDAKVDGGDGIEKGKFRWYFFDPLSTYWAFLMYSPIANPND